MGANMDGWASPIVTESLQSFGGSTGDINSICLWINQLDEQLNYWAGEQQADLQIVCVSMLYIIYVFFVCFWEWWFYGWHVSTLTVNGIIFGWLCFLWFTPVKATFIHDETYMYLAPEVSCLGAPPSTNQTDSQYAVFGCLLQGSLVLF